MGNVLQAARGNTEWCYEAWILTWQSISDISVYVCVCGGGGISGGGLVADQSALMGAEHSPLYCCLARKNHKWQL